MQQRAAIARKEREVAWLRQLWAIEGPGHPSAATLAEHYRHQLQTFRDRRLFHTVRGEVNRRGLYFMQLIDDAIEREINAAC